MICPNCATGADLATAIVEDTARPLGATKNPDTVARWRAAFRGEAEELHEECRKRGGCTCQHQAPKPPIVTDENGRALRDIAAGEVVRIRVAQ